MNNRAHYLPAVLLWGVVFGLVGAIPIISCCGCLFTLGAGVLAARAVANAAPTAVNVGEGAIIGGLTGILSGGIHGVLNATLNLLLASSLPGIYRSLGAPPALVAQLEAAMANPIRGALTALCMGIVLGPVFGALGGVIGAAVFKKPGAPGA